MKTYWGSGRILHEFLTSAVDGRGWSASHPDRFTPKERAPDIHWIGGWVGPRDILDAVVKKKIPSPRRESNPRTPILQPVQRYNTELYDNLFDKAFRDSVNKELAFPLVRHRGTFRYRYLC
jgi:hypothetical protein